jgi:hypothetical protein
MLYKIRILLLGMLSALALGGAMSSAASAAQYFVEGETVAESTNVQGTSGKSTLSSEIAKTKVAITCSTDTLSGTIKPEGKSTTIIEFKGCSVESFPNCKVKEPVKAEEKDRLVGGETKVEDEFEPLTGEAIATITLENEKEKTCILKGTYSVKGTQTCELPKGEEKLTEHEIACTALGSNLKLGSEKATFTGTEKVHLTSKKGFGEFELIQNALTVVGGGTELDFTGLGAGAKKEIKVENVGLSTVYMKEHWIEEGGVRTEANFKIVEARNVPGANVCRFPLTTEEVLGVRDWCNVGVVFESGTAGRNAIYVLKASCFWGFFWCGTRETMNIKS